jgi:pimeloyl-ACP methyl ester carboxylesterase
MPAETLPPGIVAREIRVDGLRSPVLEAGAEAAERDEAVVFVHGNPGSGRDWSDLLARVGPFARAVAPDMPGFGRADKPEGFSYTVEGYARHLDGMLAALGIRRAHLVLHDFGGPWGLVWAAGHPERVGSLTLINTGVLRGYKWHAAARVWRTPILGEIFQALSTRTGFRLLMDRTNPKGLPPGFVDRMYGDYDRGTRRAVLRLYRATANPGESAARLAPALRPLAVPTLVVWGAQDPFIGVEHAEQQRETFPAAEVVVLPESGHWPFADDPEGVAAAVVPFLRQAIGLDGSG